MHLLSPPTTYYLPSTVFTMVNQKQAEANTGARPIVFTDFDGTITQLDVTDEILAQLAHPSWQEVEQEWTRGSIGSRECLERQIALVDTSAEELHALIDAVPIDPSFTAFYRFTRKRGIPLYVLSEGFDYVIVRILKRAGVNGPVRNGIQYVLECAAAGRPPPDTLLPSFGAALRAWVRHLQSGTDSAARQGKASRHLRG